MTTQLDAQAEDDFSRSVPGGGDLENHPQARGVDDISAGQNRWEKAYSAAACIERSKPRPPLQVMARTRHARTAYRGPAAGVESAQTPHPRNIQTGLVLAWEIGAGG